MRIAFFHHYSLTHGGGGERFVIELSNYLVSRGHAVTVHALPFRRRESPVQFEGSVTYCEKPAHRAEADVSYHMYAPLASHLFMCEGPRIAGLHGAVVADYRSSSGFYMRQGPFVASAYLFREMLGKSDIEKFDAVHAVSPVPAIHRRIYVLPNWVDCTEFARGLERKEVRGDKFVVLYVGKPSYTKGFDYVEALSESLRQDDIEFWAAFPPERNQLTQSRIKWLGYVPHQEMWEVYGNASVLVHPTRQETFGRVILESLAAGTPVVTTPIPSHVSLQLPLEYGSDLQEMKAKLEALYQQWSSDYDGFRAHGASAAKEVRRFDSRALLPQYERMLVEVAKS